MQRGAYVLAEAKGGDPEALLLATGSEVSLCVNAYEELTKQGVRVRVVSMPCWQVFDKQDPEYQRLRAPQQSPGSRRCGTGLYLWLAPLRRAAWGLS